MLTVLAFLLAVIVTILILTLVLLFIPLKYDIDLNFRQLPMQFSFSLHNFCYGCKIRRIDGEMHWHFLLLGFGVPVTHKTTSKESAQQPSNPKTDKEPFSPAFWLQSILDSDWRKQAWQLTTELWGIIRPHKILIQARVGFDEPHYTGWMMGMAGILQRQSNSYRINIEGAWDEPCMQGELSLSGRVIPAMVIGLLIKYILRPKIRSYLRQMREPTKSFSQKTV